MIFGKRLILRVFRIKENEWKRKIEEGKVVNFDGWSIGVEKRKCEVLMGCGY